MTWHRVSDYCIRAGAWRICKAVVMGTQWYECWLGAESLYRKRFRSADRAKAYCA
jgi:hypothetical protein